MGGGARLRAALVVAQVAGSLVLLIIAGLFTRSLQAAQRANLGFDASHVVNFYMDPSELGYRPAQTREFYQQLLQRVRALPGVETATTASGAPLGYYNNFDALIIDGYEPPKGQPGPRSGYTITATDYLPTMRIPLLRGRAFTEADDDTAPYVAIVNQTLANRYWPNQDALGRHFKMPMDTKRTIQIVGIAADARYNGITGAMNPMFYIPFAQHVALGSLQTLQVRTQGDPAAMIPEIERVVRGLAPDLPVFDVKTMTQAINTLNGLLMFRLGAGFAAVLGALGLVLSVVGVYGVISYSASQRTQEIGIRMALGAQPRDVLVMVLRQGIMIVLAGLAVGLACAFAAGRLAGKFLAVSGADPVTYAVVSMFLASVALVACYIPARRSMNVDPMVALRHE